MYLTAYSIHHSTYYSSSSTWVTYLLPFNFHLIVFVYILIFCYHWRGVLLMIFHFLSSNETKRVSIISKSDVRFDQIGCFKNMSKVSSLWDGLHMLKYVEIRKNYNVLNNIIPDSCFWWLKYGESLYKYSTL